MAAEIGQVARHSVEPTVDQSGRMIPAPVCVNSIARAGRSGLEVADESGNEFGAFKTQTGYGAVLGCTACRNVTCIVYTDREFLITSTKTHIDDEDLDVRCCTLTSKKA